MQLIADFLNKVVTDIFFNYEVTKRITWFSNNNSLTIYNT
jgi:hypothetical protein